MTRPSRKSKCIWCDLAGALFALALVFAGQLEAAAEELQKIRGTTVSLVPPNGFEPTSRVAGFFNANIGGSIIVTELPKEAFGEFRAVLSNVETVNARFSAGGIKAITVEQLNIVAGGTVPLVHGTQSTSDGKYDKWMAVYGGENTALITLQVLEGNALDPAVARSMFASVRMGPVPSEDELLSLLPFDIQIMEPFRFLGTPTGAGVLATVGADDLNSESKQPVLFVVSQVSAVQREPLEKAAETQLRSTSSFKNAEIISRRPVVFAGADGVLFEGTSKKDRLILQYRQYFSITKDGSFIRLVAAGLPDEMQQLWSAVERTASSVAIR